MLLRLLLFVITSIFAVIKSLIFLLYPLLHLQRGMLVVNACRHTSSDLTCNGVLTWFDAGDMIINNKH